uniref:Uncharacterized protein n=1 Tax=Timema tahoe TaxID=61484 RepID=A0A7R9FJ24_9NEOP|nr:unnamed protein product [Timema tahoe]
MQIEGIVPITRANRGRVLFGTVYRGALVTDGFDNMDCGAVQAVERLGGVACASAEERDKGLTQQKCAMISAHYSMSNDFDNLVISLCKFTTLLNSPETPDALTVAFGSNPKARLAAKTVFNLAHRHGDILRDGWRNVLECVLQLYRCKLLPKVLIEADDFIDISGKILLLREETPSQKTETGLFSSLYSYIALGASGR